MFPFTMVSSAEKFMFVQHLVQRDSNLPGLWLVSRCKGLIKTLKDEFFRFHQPSLDIPLLLAQELIS